MPLPSRPGLPSEPRKIQHNEPQVPVFSPPSPRFVEEEPEEFFEEIVEEETYHTPEQEETRYNPNPVEPDADYDEDEEEIDDEEVKRAQILQNLSPRSKQSARILLEHIRDEECVEVLLHGPQKVIVNENGNRMLLPEVKFESVEEYHNVINALILHDTDTEGRIGNDEGKGLIEGQLELPDYDNPAAPPLLARVTIITPPVLKTANVTIAKKSKRSLRVDDFVTRNSMSPNMAAFLKAIARGRATTVFSGLSGAGKTTLLEALSHEFDENDRVILIEDISELRIPLYDVVPLLSTPRKPGQKQEDIVTLEWLVAQANRMRGDRIIVGECRGGEFLEFLAAANSGADGSMTTLHASSPRQSIDRMRLLAAKNPAGQNEASIMRDIALTVQLIVQMDKIDGQRIVTQISEVSDTITANNNVALQPLFEYDRLTRRWAAKGRPSEKLTTYLAGRGVSLDRNWFDRLQ